MKPVIILAKGPSARFLEASDKYDVATVNNAIWMHKTPKWSFFNDLEPMEQMEDNDFKGVKTMIIPSFLHTTANPRFNGVSGHFHFHRLAEFFPERFEHIDFHLYELHPGDNVSEEERKRTGLENSNVPSLDEWPRSTGQSAAMWLMKYEDRKDFITMGCDPKGGYHPYFEKRALKNKDGSPAFNGASTNAWDAEGYKQDFDQSLRWAKHYGARFRHIDDLSEKELEDLDLL
tara:strand:- start:256 stop:951 length:696 start_codon:yes stop_codon:yes gene_type:complete